MTGYGQNGQNGTHGSKPRPRTGIAYEAEDFLLSENWQLSWLMKVAVAAMRLLWCVGCAMPELQKLLTNSCMYMVSAGVCGML